MPNGITLLGLVALLVLKFGANGQPSNMPMMQEDQMPDVWTTPYYLRYNVALPTSQVPILPTQATNAWALATRSPG